jgi:hypothetical protein
MANYSSSKSIKLLEAEDGNSSVIKKNPLHLSLNLEEIVQLLKRARARENYPMYYTLKN